MERPSRRESAAVIGIVALALVLRLWGITWGLPNQERVLSYHPDEGPNLVQGVLDRSGAARPHLALGFYNYGGLYFYLWQGAAAINATYGAVRLPPIGAPGRPAPDSPAALILVGRLLTALLGALTAWAVYALGRRLFSRAAGLAAGALYAVTPAAVVHGHYATVDATAAFFVTLALVFAARLLSNPSPRHTVAPSLIAGLFCGLAVAAKYNAGLVLLAPLTALWTRGVASRKSQVVSGPKTHATSDTSSPLHPVTPSLLAILGAALGFLLGCTGALLEPGEFWRDITFEVSKSGEGMGLLFAQTGNGWWYHLSVSMRLGLGVPLLLLSVAAFGFALARRSRSDRLLLAFFVPYYLLIGWAQVRFLRYILPLLPLLAVWCGRLLAEALTSCPPLPVAGEGESESGLAPSPPGGRGGQGVRAGRGVRVVAATLGIVAFLAALLISLAMDRLMTMPDARDRALAYIRGNVPAGRSIAFAAVPWYDTPPMSPLFTALDPRVRRRAAQDVTEYALRLPSEGTEWDMGVFEPPPDHVLLTDLQAGDALRIGYAPALRFEERLQVSYAPRVFQNTPTVFGMDFGKPAWVPNDWLYPYPRITLYTLGRTR